MADTPELPEMDVTEEDRRKAVELCNSGGILICGVLAEARVAQLLACERQLREAHATIAALRAQDDKTSVMHEVSSNRIQEMDWELQKLRAPLPGPAMEALTRACAEEVWQMYREPHNLTWTALKERTFEAVAAVVVGTQGALLERVRELEGRLRAATICPKCNFPVSTHWTNTTNGETGCSVSIISNPAQNLMAHAEAAEAQVRELEEGLKIIADGTHARWDGKTYINVPFAVLCSWNEQHNRVRDLEAAAGAARRVCGHMAKRMREEYSLDITEEWMQAVANGEHDKVLPTREPKGKSK